MVFSKLQPGLATLYVLDDGAVAHEDLDAKPTTVCSPRIRYARQNGVPLVEPDPATGAPAPGRAGRQVGARQLVRLRRPESCARCAPAPASRRRPAGAS